MRGDDISAVGHVVEVFRGLEIVQVGALHYLSFLSSASRVVYRCEYVADDSRSVSILKRAQNARQPGEQRKQHRLFLLRLVYVIWLIFVFLSR